MFLNTSLIFVSAIDSLFPNVWTFITHIVAVIFLLLIIIFYAWKPTKKFLEKRKEFINKEIDQIKKKQEDANIALDEANKFKKKSIEELVELKKQTELEMMSFKKNVEKEAEESAKKIIDNANSYLLEQEQEMKKNYNNEIINLSLEITTSLLNKKVDKKINDELTDLIIKELEEKK